MQKLDRLSGVLVVRDAKANERHGDLYDFDDPDHVITIMDWMNPGGTDDAPGRHINGDIQLPEALFINGLGQYSVSLKNLLWWIKRVDIQIQLETFYH